METAAERTLVSPFALQLRMQTKGIRLIYPRAQDVTIINYCKMILLNMDFKHLFTKKLF